MPVEIFGVPYGSAGGSGGATFTAGVSSGGNTAGTTGTVSNGMLMYGGANITLSQSSGAGGASVSIVGGAGGAFTGGISSGGNTAGTTGTVSNGILFFGGNNVTLSGSSAAGGASISFVGPNTGSFTAGVSSGGNSAGTTGTVSNGIRFFGGNSITLSQSSAAGGATISVVGPSAWSQSGGMSNLGNTSGTSGIASGSAVRLLFAGGTNITLSQSVNGASGTVTIIGPTQSAQTGISGIAGSAASTVTAGTIQFANANGVSFGLNGSTMTASYTQSVPPLISKFYQAQAGNNASQQQNGTASFNWIEIPYDISFSRIDVPVNILLGSSATANTGNVEISSGLVIYSISNSSTLNPIAGAFGTTTYTWASNTANFSNLTGGRLMSFPVATTLPAGFYYVGLQLSTTNNSSIGTATTQYTNSLNVPCGNYQTSIGYGDIGAAIVAGSDVMPGQGLASTTFTATNATVNIGNITATGAAKNQGAFHIVLRNF